MRAVARAARRVGRVTLISKDDLYVRNRRIRRTAGRDRPADRRAQAPRVSRLRLGRHRDDERQRPRDAQSEGQDLACSRRRRERQPDARARSASRTRAGRRTARRTSATRIRTSTARTTIAVVHNGIIENYGALRTMLKKQGHKFVSETDTEVLAHLIEAAFDGEARGRGDRRAEPRRGDVRHRRDLEPGPGQDRRARARAARC